MFFLLLFFPVVFSLPVHSRYDLNNDKRVENGEMEVVAYADYAIPKGMIKEVFTSSDIDGNDFLEGEEIEKGKRLVEEIAEKETEKWLKIHDVNKDSSIQPSEFLLPSFVSFSLPKTELENIFVTADSEQDNKLELREVMEARRLLRNRMLTEADQLLKHFDTNSDHRLSLPEAQLLADVQYDVGTREAEEIVHSSDGNSDGSINGSEIGALIELLRTEAIKESGEKMKLIDRNSNGMLSYEEVKNYLGREIDGKTFKKLFKSYDMNKNSLVEPPELVSLQGEIARIHASKKDEEITDHKIIKLHPKMVDNIEGTPRKKRETGSAEYEPVAVVPIQNNDMEGRMYTDDDGMVQIHSQKAEFEGFGILRVKEDRESKENPEEKKSEESMDLIEKPSKFTSKKKKAQQKKRKQRKRFHKLFSVDGEEKFKTVMAEEESGQKEEREKKTEKEEMKEKKKTDTVALDKEESTTEKISSKKSPMGIIDPNVFTISFGKRESTVTEETQRERKEMEKREGDTVEIAEKRNSIQTAKPSFKIEIPEKEEVEEREENIEKSEKSQLEKKMQSTETKEESDEERKESVEDGERTEKTEESETLLREGEEEKKTEEPENTKKPFNDDKSDVSLENKAFMKKAEKNWKLLEKDDEEGETNLFIQDVSSREKRSPSSATTVGDIAMKHDFHGTAPPSENIPVTEITEEKGAEISASQLEKTGGIGGGVRRPVVDIDTVINEPW